ncbi:hypothetical protein G7054_g11240 [Neopestalotiopsis clavispora]|nr:hypothetical protein G7054_g11240 [Neopestalotiopsis clavispora]
MGAFTELSPIPGPRALPLIGNLLDIDLDAALESMVKLADTYGPLFKITFNGQTELVACSQEIVNELCDETRFYKAVSGGIERLRPGTGDGLFTAYDGEEGWEIAHRILMPAFGPIAIRDTFPQMNDLANQLCLKWFNSFYQGDKLDPFIESMISFLAEGSVRSALPDWMNSLRMRAAKRFGRDIKVMERTCLAILQKRRKSPVASDDLLNRLLNGRDPQSGKGMTDAQIVHNLITFLIAGHETTSGLLSFTTYYMLKHPAAYKKARNEVDSVVGDSDVNVGHLSQLKYLDAMLKESLRLMPTAPGFAVKALKPEVLGGKFAVDMQTPINILLHASQTESKVFGTDAKEWRPERMLDDNFAKLPHGCYKPFGNGKRGCIGRAFAWQEALLVLAMLLRNFDLKLCNPDYELKYVETLTIKPDGLRINASLREDRSTGSLLPSLGSHPKATDPNNAKFFAPADATAAGPGITILYGSNAGTCKALAYRLATDFGSRGLRVAKIAELDCAVRELHQGEVTVIVTASYDGQPTDNAKAFVSWLDGMPPSSLENVHFAVFGCGHHDWAKTFQRVPKLLDTLLESAGANSLATFGNCDVADSDPYADLECWNSTELCPAIQEHFKLGNSLGLDAGTLQLDASLSLPLRATVRHDTVEAVVTSVKVLTAPGAPEKRSLEFSMARQLDIRPGDHFYVMVENSTDDVDRILAHFHLAPDCQITIKSFSSTGLPANTTLTVTELLRFHVELTQPVTPKNIEDLRHACDDEKTLRELNALVDQSLAKSRSKIASVMDLLLRFPGLKITFEVYVAMLNPLRDRIYSLSSAPCYKPLHASITYSVVTRNPHADMPELGVGSNFLRNLRVGSVLYISYRPAKPSFHLPEDPSKTPIIMICAGSGLAPFRSFVEERFLQIRRGERIAPALLYFGCRRPGEDDIHAEDLQKWESAGALETRHVYSRAENETGADMPQVKYVQDQLLVDRKEIELLLDQGAKIYICGTANMARAARANLESIFSMPLPEDRLTVETF